MKIGGEKRECDVPTFTYTVRSLVGTQNKGSMTRTHAQLAQ